MRHDETLCLPSPHVFLIVYIVKVNILILCSPPVTVGRQENVSIARDWSRRPFQIPVMSRNLYKPGRQGPCKRRRHQVQNTVEPVYNGPVLSGHPLLSGQFSKSWLFAHTNAAFVTCIRWPPLLSGCGHPVAVLCLSFFVIFTCIKRPPLNGN